MADNKPKAKGSATKKAWGMTSMKTIANQAKWSPAKKATKTDGTKSSPTPNGGK